MRTVLLFLVLFLGLNSTANVDQSNLSPTSSSSKASNRKLKAKGNYCKNLFEIDKYNSAPDLIVPDYSFIQEEFDYQKLNKILPADLTPTNEATKVFNKIADKSINTILASESFKTSSLGMMSENIKEKTKTEIKFNSSLAPSIQHQMKAELLPFQGQTKFSYQGFFDADLIFKNNLNDYEFKIHEKLFNKNVFYQNQITKNISSNQLGVSWDW
jgi:hypothetical protein